MKENEKEFRIDETHRELYCCRCEFYREEGVIRTCAKDDYPIKHWHSKACDWFRPLRQYEDADLEEIVVE